MLELKDVTLCAVGSFDLGPTARAMEISMRHCKFADAILFSHDQVPGPFRNVKKPPPADIGVYNRFILKELYRLFQTPFVLITQWDGYVVDPRAWRNEFLQYDYIGARWTFRDDPFQVGNGGFSLRSRRLMEIMAGEFPILPGFGEDELIGRVYRPLLEREFGIRFAPPEIADRFAYEIDTPAFPTFGFHGLMNFWRHVPDAELGAILDQLPRSVFLSKIQCGALTWAYYARQRWVPLREFYRRWRKHVSAQEVFEMIEPFAAANQFEQCKEICEQMLAGGPE
ncbi:MAG: DUF5672 family protein [Tepidisphaeraceae bacterium]|jgi:hypothetical protein